MSGGSRSLLLHADGDGGVRQWSYPRGLIKREAGEGGRVGDGARGWARRVRGVVGGGGVGTGARTTLTGGPERWVTVLLPLRDRELRGRKMK
jgi:hypothetical protein